MDFLVLGLNHKSAPLEIRERVTFPSSKILEALQSLGGYPAIEECLILSTCNRVELYAITTDNLAGLGSLKKFLCDYHNFDACLDQYLYLYQNQQAVSHLFRVVSSLDSMIVGENQILSQVRQAQLSAQNTFSIGKFLLPIFQEALRVGKEVRTQTNIGKGAVSISSAAVELAERILKDLAGKKILIIGAGKIGELTVKSLSNRGIRLILVANRTYEKAVRLAEVFRGEAIRFDRLPRALAEVDIVINSTSALHYILRYPDIISAMNKRLYKPLFLIDLGLPRNIEQSISGIENVHLYNIDDLDQISQLNLQERLNEASRAEEVVKEAAEAFYAKIKDIFLDELVVC